MERKRSIGIILIGCGEILFGLLGISMLVTRSGLETFIAPIIILGLPFGIGIIRLKQWARLATIVYLGLWFFAMSGCVFSVLRQQITKPNPDNHLYALALIFGLISLVPLSQAIYLFFPKARESFTA